MQYENERKFTVLVFHKVNDGFNKVASVLIEY